jgi:hypothetical protein
MKSVWILLIYMAGNSYHGGPVVIDDIVNKEECVRVQNVVAESDYVRTARCIEVRKAK